MEDLVFENGTFLVTLLLMQLEQPKKLIFKNDGKLEEALMQQRGQKKLIFKNNRISVWKILYRYKNIYLENLVNYLTYVEYYGIISL